VKEPSRTLFPSRAEGFGRLPIMLHLEPGRGSRIAASGIIAATGGWVHPSLCFDEGAAAVHKGSLFLPHEDDEGNPQPRSIARGCAWSRPPGGPPGGVFDGVDIQID
jgi:hypothetical protein